MDAYKKSYVSFLKKFLKHQKELKIVFDCSNGSAGPIISGIMNNELRIKNKKKSAHNLSFIILNSDPDGNFPAHDPNPLKKNALKDLKSAVIKNKADLGIIFDADGDRAFFIDASGRLIDPDTIAYLLIFYLKPKKVALDLRANWAVRNYLHKQKIRAQETKVGNFSIKKLMHENDIDFGFEESGHFYYKNFFYSDSGIFTAIQTVNAVSSLPYSLGDFNDLIPQSFKSGEINFKCDPESTERILKRVEEHYDTVSQKFLKKKSHLDGLVMEFNEPDNAWWFNLRPSNTEPLLRLNIEAKSPQVLEKEKTKIIRLLRSTS